MSTDRKRLNSAIQRIAREDPEIRKLLDEFRNSGGKPSESATSGSGAEDRQICCDGSSGSNPNPGSDTRDPNENPQDGIDPDDPANISDNLTGVTDCATGTPICFAGSDWIPPDGWDSPTDPPIDPTYVEGEYWILTIEDSTSIVATCGAAHGAAKGYLGACDFDTSTLPSCPDDFGVGFGAQRELCPGGGAAASRMLCSETYDPICDEDAPLAEYWPNDGCVNLAVKGGKLVGSKYDPENGGSWSAPRNEVELCDAFGNSFTLKASGSIDGGWKSISSQNPDDGYLYNAQGQQIARISESEYSDPTI